MKATQSKKDTPPIVGQKKISSFFTSRVGQQAGSVAANDKNHPEKENRQAAGVASEAAAPSPKRVSPRLKQRSSAPNDGPAGDGVAAVAATAAAAATQQPGAELVGCRVRVYWPLDKAWYKGKVAKWDGTAKYHVKYDDGDTEWVDFTTEKYEVLKAAATATAKAAATASDSPAIKAVGGGAAARASRKRGTVLMSEDEEEDENAVRGGGGGGAKGAKPAPAAKRLVRNAVVSSDGSGSEWDGEAEASDSDAGVSDLEDELSDGGVEEEDAPAETGAKRKRGQATGASKGPKRLRKKGAAATPAAAAATAAKTPAPTGAKAFKHTTPLTGTANGHGNGVSPGTALKSVTPKAGAKGDMHRALEITPAPSSGGRTSAASTPGSVVHGVATPSAGGDGDRFLSNMASRFPFLAQETIRDAQKRRPDHPNYDPSTVFIPETWFKEQKVSDGQKQWWGFKARHYDSVLLFKMGKFYEMFEMDALVGCDVLGLSFMKGEKAHAGFPEVRYHDMAEKLARAGYKVVVVEQVENPEGLKLRNEERKRKGLKMDNVVAREKVAVVSKGTLIDAEMVAASPDAAYVMAVFEIAAPTSASCSQAAPMDATCSQPEAVAAAAGGGGTGGTCCAAPVVTLGLCIADVASGQVIVGQFCDDEVRSSLRTHLTSLQPVELVLPRAALSDTTTRVLQTCLRAPRSNVIRGDAGDWSADKAIQRLSAGKYFSEAELGSADPAASSPLPPVLSRLVELKEAGEAALAALDGMVAFLKEALLDRAVLPLGRFEPLAEVQHSAAASGGSSDAAAATAEATAAELAELTGPATMLLNGAALENLEILENGEGQTRGTLLAVLDHCCTPFGRRRLRQWLCRPLFRVADISRRQDAVADLAGQCSSVQEAAGKARKHLAGVSDLERAVARLHASMSGAMGRDAAHVVLYEDAAKRRVFALISAVKDIQAVSRAVGEFQSATGDMGSALLRQLTAAGGRWGEVAREAEVLAGAADWSLAKETGRVIPAQGINAPFDEACAEVAEVEAKLQAHLKEVRQKLGGGANIKFVSVNKDSHLIEVPEGVKVPSNYDLRHQRSGFKRYSNPKLAELVAELDEAQGRKEAANATILQGIVARFVEHQSLWMWAVECVAQLDALMALAAHAMHADGPMCRPTFIIPEAGCSGVFDAKGLRHPAGLPGREGSFVPNDIQLGGADGRPFLVLTGPNMGGKSTLLRQVCLATVLAQVGACVPAESLTLSAMDAVFVRMGARDAIMTGQSTFFVELFETGAMLNRATRRSLVALDELGRGTATLDGAAIAGAVLQHLAGSTRCLGLFATHYHHLATQHASDSLVSIMHMGCALDGLVVQDGEQDDSSRVQAVTFLYKLTAGACPKSYGTNVAMLAGLPSSVVHRGAQISSAREANSHIGRDTACPRSGGDPGGSAAAAPSSNAAGVVPGSRAVAPSADGAPGAAGGEQEDYMEVDDVGGAVASTATEQHTALWEALSALAAAVRSVKASGGGGEGSCGAAVCCSVSDLQALQQRALQVLQ